MSFKDWDTYSVMSKAKKELAERIQDQLQAGYREKLAEVIFSENEAESREVER